MDKINTQIIQRRDKFILHCYRGLTVRKALLYVICAKHVCVWYRTKVTSRYKNYLFKVREKLEMHVNKTQIGLTRLKMMRMEWVTTMPVRKPY
jgi:hypothetical protein